jgi:Tfp pilus assembly protein PilF
MAPRRAIRLVASGVGLACVALYGGCVLAPRPAAVPAPAPAAMASPQAGRDGVPSVSVDLSRTAGENVTFRKTATERQKFQVHVDFGKIFEVQGNLDGAIQEYRDALNFAEGRGRGGQLTADDEALAHRRIASALDRQGQFGQSEPHYQKALKLAPRDPKVWNDAGYSYYLQGRWAEAERSLRTALKLAPDDTRVRTNLGMALAAAGKAEAALPLLSTNQGDAIAHANLGYLLASTGQFERARQEYQAALSIRPDLTLARRALAQLDRQEHGVASPPTALAARTVAAPQPVASMARNTPVADKAGRVDPRVITTSAPAAGDIILPPLPPVPPPEVPTRAHP